VIVIMDNCMNPKRWLHEHSLKLLAIRDTPNAIAGGITIGFFFSVTPLFGFKTLLTLLIAWLTGSNVLAAFLASAAHNIAWPLMPLLYRGEYDVGYWLLNSPHHFPPSLLKGDWQARKWLDWHFVYGVGRYMLLGSFVCAAPFSLIIFFLSRKIVSRHHRKQAMENGPAAE